MIPNNLKVGDTYSYNGNVYEVMGYDYEGRIVAKRVEGKTSAPKATEVSEPIKATTNYDSMGIKELQALCKEKGLKIRGSKAEVIERLKGAK